MSGLPGIFVGVVIKYTLYIDESGDFESSKGQWVVAGILLADSYEDVEKKLSARFRTVPEKFGLKSIKEFHLTEFRRKFGHAQANLIARHVFKTLDGLPIEFHGMATINLTKSELSEREKTYRLMLADILALCETVLPEDQLISRLDLVVASRTIHGVRQTTISDIDHDVIKTLPMALEVDLATKGLVDLMGRNLKVHMDYANNSWGLVCADFLANLSYHNKKSEEKKILDDLHSEGKYSLFESFGSFDVRRAHVAERSRDYALGIYRWIVIAEKTANRDCAKEAIQRLLHKLFTQQGTTGYEVAFEELIERLWRPSTSVDKYEVLLNGLDFLDAELLVYFSANKGADYGHLLFRTRNLALLICNHLGSTTRANSIIDAQRESLSVLATNPEFFSRVLDFKILEAETAVNALEFEKALSLAIEYSEIIDTYRSVWQLLTDSEDISGFDKSRSHIKSEMSLFRISILCLGLSESLAATDVEYRAQRLELLISNISDSSRLANYRVMLLLKLSRPREALRVYADRLEDEAETCLSSFDLLWLLRSMNDAALSSTSFDAGPWSKYIEKQIASFDTGRSGHPNDVVLREIALYEFMKGSTSRAKKLIAKSSKAMILGDSEISRFLVGVNKVHEDHIYGRRLEKQSYFHDSLDSGLVGKINEVRSELDFLKQVRYFSPY